MLNCPNVPWCPVTLEAPALNPPNSQLAEGLADAIAAAIPAHILSEDNQPRLTAIAGVDFVNGNWAANAAFRSTLAFDEDENPWNRKPS